MMRKILLLSTALIAGATSPVVVLAQTASTTAANTGIEEVVVTAQRKAQGEEHAAIALNVIQGSAISDAGIVAPDRLQHLVPALTVEPTSTGNILFIRGVGNFTVVPSSDPAIAFNYDGVYVGRPTSTSGVFYDLDRVEVLKGPQGILYGRNATGGAINVLPTQPQIGEDFSGDASISYGNYNALVVQGAVNIPTSDTSAFRIAASGSYHDGYLHDGTDDDDTTSVRAQFKDEVTPNLTVRIAGDYSHTGGQGQGVSYINAWSCPENSPAAAVGSAAGACSISGKSGINLDQGVETPASQAWRVTHAVGGPDVGLLTPLTPHPFNNDNYYGLNAQVDYDTGFGVLTIIPAWRDSKLNLFSNAAAFYAGDKETDEQTSAEIRFAGKRISIFDYTVGFYDYNEEIKSDENINLTAQAAWLKDDFKTNSYAPFGEVTANITDNFRLVSGIRYTEDKKTLNGVTDSMLLECVLSLSPNMCTNYGIPYSQSYNTLPASYVASLPGGTLPALGTVFAPNITYLTALHFLPDLIETSEYPQHQKSTNSRATFREAAEWDITDTSMAYASYETGYRSGGFNSSPTYPTYAPEYIDAYTFGVKNRLFDNQLQLNVEAFDWDYKNQQVNHVSLDPQTGAPANFTANVGASKIKGAEVDAIALVTDSTLLSADIQYLDATYSSYIYSAAYTVTPLGVASPLTGCPTTKGVQTVVIAGVSHTFNAWNINCSGFPSYNSPKWTINLSAQQTVGMDWAHLPSYQTVLTFDTQYKSQYDNGFSYLSDEVIPGRWTSDAQIQFEPKDEGWSIMAYVRNIENNQTPEFSTFGPLSYLSVATISQPRTYGVRLSMKF